MFINPGKNLVADSLSRCCVNIEVDEKSSCIEKCHNSIVGHHGISKTLKLLRSSGYSWEGMKRDVVSYVRSCVLCQKSRITVKDTAPPEYHVIETFEPFEEVSVDYMVYLPKDEAEIY